MKPVEHESTAVPDRPYAERLKLLALAQLRVGVFGFGGPLATMAMMRDELIEKRKLSTPARYLEALGAVKLLPGPVSSLLAVFLGHEIAGVLGGLVAVTLFIAPSFCMLLALGFFEAQLAHRLATPTALSTFAALQASVIAVILFNCYKLFRDAHARVYNGRREPLWVGVFAVAAAALALFHTPEILILLLCALSGVVALRSRKVRVTLRLDLVAVFLVFFKAGLTVFGTGYMVLPYLQRVLVDERHWITAATFLEAVTYGNLTPGPVVIASTYMGFKMAGIGGAFAATIGMFAGPIVLMLVLAPHLRKLLGKPWVEGALLGLLPAVAATIALSLTALARDIAWSPLNIAVGIAALAVLMTTRVPAWMVLAVSGVVGALGGYFV